VSGIGYWITSQNMHNYIVQQAATAARVIEKQVSVALINNDITDIKKIVEKYGYQNSNEYILIVDAKYNIIAGINDKRISDALLQYDKQNAEILVGSNEMTVIPLRLADKMIYNIIVPLGDGYLGFLHYGINITAVSPHLTTVFWKITVYVLLISALMYSFIYYIIKKQIFIPMAQITEAATAISLGKFDTTAIIPGNKDFQELIAAIERMRESLKTSINRLRNRSSHRHF
jgi:methyl-accepting chemotaxis protein